MITNVLYHCCSLLWHGLTAWNTGGEGVHSPRLFYLVRHVMGDASQLYAWEDIEQRRQAMLRAPKLVHVRDFGTGQDRDELVSHIARTSVMGCRQAQLLSRLLNYMNGREYVPDRQRPLRIVELGTSLGLTTAYLAAIDGRNTVDTFEGSDEIAAMAVLNWNKLGLSNIHSVVGPIDDTLLFYTRDAREKIDWVLMDANHTGEATCRYFQWLLPLMDKDGVVVIDDIRYSADMYRAWRTICGYEGVTATMDLGNMGLVFFCPSLQQRTYKMRI